MKKIMMAVALICAAGAAMAASAPPSDVECHKQTAGHFCDTYFGGK